MKCNTMNDTNSLGSFFYNLRINRGFSLRELSEKSGVPITTISDLERDRVNNPKVVNMINILKALKI